MARTFFRIQGTGLSLAEMQEHNSANGAGDEEHEGLCASDSVTDLRNYISGWAVGDMDEGFEVVIYHGRRLDDIYDGVLTYPTEILERVTVSSFLVNDRFCEYESW